MIRGLTIPLSLYPHLSACKYIRISKLRTSNHAMKQGYKRVHMPLTRIGLIMIESEGITENVKTWRTDAAAKIISALGLEKVMFEAADPEVFAWYIKNYGPEVNVFVDHSQIVQLECLRAGIWGTKSLWGRVLTYKG